MRRVLLLAVLMLLPVAAARPILYGEERVGPCTVAWDHEQSGEYWHEPTYEKAWCSSGGEEVVFVGEGSGLAREWCLVRALGTTVFECPP